MKHFFISLFVILALVTGLMSGMSVARAQEVCPSGQVMDPFGTCMTQASLDAQNTTATEAQKAAANTQTDYSGKDDAAYNGIMMRIMTLFAWLVGVAAITLDNAVYYTVVTMGNYVGHLSAIGVTWRILRDIGNIALIFGFLGIGISVILNVNWYGGKTKMLPMLLVAAIFLNFSLFFTEAVIDTGNLFATQFYKQINGGNPASAKNFDAATISNDGISNKIMAQLGLQSIYGQVRQNNKAAEIFKGGNPWIVGFMGILLFIITAFVLFSLAFILISRFIYLIFLIIFAPIGFAGLAVPQLKARADKWWSALFAQTITAPVLLLLLYVALAVITDAQFLTGFGTTKDWTGFVTGNYTGFASMMLSFFVAMGLLLLVTIQAKSLSAFGAGKATSLAGKLTFGATAFGLRSTVGAGSQAASRFVRGRSWGASKTGRILSGTLDRGAKASFDVRGVTAGGGLKGLGLDAGKVTEGGYKAREEKSAKAHEEYAKSLTASSIERKQTEEETNKILAAKAKQKEAEDRHVEAANDHDVVAQRLNLRRAEVARIEEEKKKDKYWGADLKNEQRLEAARQALSTEEAEHNTAATKLAQAQKDKNTRTAEAEKTKEDIKTATSQSAKEKYAETIKGPLFGNSIPGWALFGPGGAIAAKNIVKKKKNTVDLDEMKKFLEAKDAPVKEEKPPEAH